MKLFIASMIAAYAAACCPAGDRMCWMKVYNCKDGDDKCAEMMEYDIAHPEKNGGYECGKDEGRDKEEDKYRDNSPDLKDMLEGAVQELSQWVYQDKDGKMKIKNVPDFAWNAVSDAEKEDFMKRSKANSEASQRAFTEAGMELAQKVQEPWNDFVKKAEDQSKKDANNDLDQDEEVADWMLKNIYIGGKSIGELYPHKGKDWDAQRDAARKEISRWSFDDLMFHLPSDKKAMLVADTKAADTTGDAASAAGEASMQQKFQQIVRLVQKSSAFDLKEVGEMLSNQAREWEMHHMDGQIRQLEQTADTTQAVMAYIRDNLEQLRKDAQSGLTDLSEEEMQLIDQAIKNIENAEMEIMGDIYEEIMHFEDEMRRMNDTVRNETAWNETISDVIEGGENKEECYETEAGMECYYPETQEKCNEKGCWSVKLSSKKGASQQKSTFASSFGYGAAAGAALGAVVCYVASNKSKTTDSFERV